MLFDFAAELAADIAALDTLTPDELRATTAAAERFAATGNEDQWDRAYRAELEKRALSLALTAPVQITDIHPGDLVEATTASTHPRTTRVLVDRTPWSGNERSTVLSDGRGVIAVLTDTLRVASTSTAN
ncbi:hypothetical protein DQ384_26070 [Sphaerisporangium album]|uniref:Uncharacterized protein n=1 Tax=Sphaerisporangium album TaxID=509200 RepID=A0A367FB64_9ACTN|nr:hypothetical protein [Sphaerisporangium album]RCG27189.1 hypothetical protein DQ384_26070 [Sphaerisporangium album]